MSRFASVLLSATSGMLCLGAAFGAPSVGAPDFAPNPSVGWIAAGAQFLPPSSGPGPVRFDPGRPRANNNDLRERGAQPTFPVGDLSNPILQPWAREQMRKHNADVVAGKSVYSRQASCWPIGVPGFLLYPVQPVYFVQAPKEVLMIWQADHQVRHIYLDVRHSANPKVSDYGESVGHYEGDTLVVDTIGVNPRTFIDSSRTPHTEILHVIERFRMIDGGKTLEVNVHVEDPGAFTTPWNAMQRYRRSEPGVAEATEALNAVSSTGDAGPMLESSCAENPNALFGAVDAYPIPQAEKPYF
ncbi:MAG: hypothetical protein EXR00_00865 [Alphaproteobacteria bacterium]|nr:hypothetical protein [Alphaproteobacteria bacterium]